MSDFICLADIERETGLPRHVINYAINRRGPEPIGRVGITRVWPRSALNEIRTAIERTARSGHEVVQA